MKITSLLNSSLVALGLVCSAQAATFTLGGGGGNAGAFGNSYAFGPVSGVSLTVTAFGYNTSTSSFQTAGVSQWSGGLGVANQTEGLSPGSPNHAMDNSGTSRDYLLFTFSQAVTLTGVNFGWYQTDDDFKYWIGTNLTTANLGSGGTSVNGTGLGSYSISGTGNTFWIAAEPSSWNDYIKVNSVSFVLPPSNNNGVPDSGSTLILLGLGLLGLVGLKRRSAA